MIKKLLSFLFLATPMLLWAQGSSWQTATLLTSGKTVTHTFTENKYEAWYKVEAPEEGKIHIEAHNNETTFDWSSVYVIQNGELVSLGNLLFDDNWANMTFDITDTKKGTFYIQLSRNPNYADDHSYTLTYLFTKSPYANDIKDNDTLGKGSLLAIGRKVSGRLGYRDYSTLVGDDYDEDIIDCYRIEVPEDGKVLLTLEAEKGLSVFEFDLIGNINGGDFTWRGEIFNTEEWYDNNNHWFEKKTRYQLCIPDAGRGVYYVQVYGGRGGDFYQHAGEGQGGYTLRYDFKPNYYDNDAEPNDDFAHAQEIKDGQTVTGHLGYQRADDTIDFTDIYKMQVQKSVNLIYNPDTAANINLWQMILYREEANGTMTHIDTRSPGNLTGQILQTNLTPGTYYLELKKAAGQGGDNDSECGGYSLTFGEPKVASDFPVRIHYNGANATRYLIPTSFDITVENISDKPTDSFFINIPLSEDITPLYAELPCDTGIIVAQAEELGRPENNCPTFYCPGLAPFESYTFTFWAYGNQIQDENFPSPASINPHRVAGALTFGAVVATVGIFVTGMVIDRTVNVYKEKLIKKELLNKEKIDEISKACNMPLTKYRQEKKDYNVGVHTLEAVAQKVGGDVMKVVPYGSAVYTTANVVSTVKDVGEAGGLRFYYENGRMKTQYEFQKWLDSTDDKMEIADGKIGFDKVARSIDPNEMVGPAGYGDKNYIGQTRTMNYRIFFENKKEATAPAYRIRITDVLDENVFDVNSVRFMGTSHDGIGYNWKMTREGNKVMWDIEGIELPPNVNAPEGEGYVSFSVKLKPGLKNGTEIKNQATIIFDYNEPIETNVYVNTLDLAAPSSRMLSAVAQNGKVTIKCEGQDSESGIARYRFFVSNNGKDYIPCGERFEGENEYTLPQGANLADYSFYALTVDNVGNMQQTPPMAISATSGIAVLQAAPVDKWAIYRLNGIKVAEGKGAIKHSLPAGIYIIQTNDHSRKMVVKD